MSRLVGFLKAGIHSVLRNMLNVANGGAVEAFSPMMLQVQTSPPAPLARAIAGALSLFLFFLLVWSVWADFDVIVSASGVAIPSSKTKVVQPLDAGRVTAIHVKDGDLVERGSPLIELDSTVATADRERVEQDNLGAILDIQRLRAQLAGDMSLSFISGKAGADLVDWQKHLLQSRIAEQQKKVAVLDQEISRKRSEFGVTSATISKIEAALPMLRQRLEMRELLLKDGFISELAVIENRLELASQVHELDVLKEKLSESRAALRAAELSKTQVQAEYISRVSAEMNDAQRRLQAGRQEFVKAVYKESYQVLEAPIAGTVQQLAVNTIGGVVNPGQGLLTVVPREGGVEVEAQVLNKDVGFLQAGMPASIKLDAFEFTKYGTLDGVVQWVGADAVKDDKLGTYYPVRILLKNTKLPVAVKDRHPEIRIGMAVTADISIGQRKAYEFFLGPLLKYKNESLRER